MKGGPTRRTRHRRMRLLGILVDGNTAAGLAGALSRWIYAPAVGWTAATLIYNASAKLTIAPMEPVRTS